MPTSLIGMLHLPALPGAPSAERPLADIESQAVAEAKILESAGFDAAVLENFGDVPFGKTAGVETVAFMTRIACAVRAAAPGLELGINVLRNDARAALAVATASGAAFIRVNVHVGATATDQGIIEGRASETLRARAALGSSVAIWSDVHVKHGRSLAHETIAEEAEDAAKRGLADALIVSGAGTGKPTSTSDLEAVKARGLGCPIYVGSGVTEDNVAALLAVADGVIVGTSLKAGASTLDPLDAGKAESFVRRARDASS